MSASLTCPRCGRPVSGPPPDMEPTAHVSCPWCREQYALGDALDFAAPALVVVGEPAAVVTMPVDEALRSTSEREARPSGSNGTPAHEFAFEPLDEPDRDTTSGSGDSQQADAGLSLDSDPLAELAGSGPATIDFEPSETDASAPASDDAAAAFAKSILVDAKVDRRRRREPSALGTIISVVAAAPVGLGLGYFILLWLGGPDKDFLDFGPKLPGWMVPASFSKPAAPGPSRDASGKSTPAATQDSAARQLSDRTTQRGPADEQPRADGSKVGATNRGAAQPAPATDEGPAVRAPSDPAVNPHTNNEPGDASASQPAAKPPTAETAPTATPPKKPAAPVDTSDVPPPPQKPGLRDAITYSLSDLDLAVKLYHEGRAELGDARTADKEEVRKLRSQLYRRLYHLAEIVTFAAGEQEQAAIDLRRESVRELIVQTAADAGKRREMGVAAAQWLSSARQRGSERGVILTGAVKLVERRGDLYELRMQLDGGSEVATVVSDREPKVKPKDSAVVVGSIVENPAEGLVGYHGDQPQVIWSGMQIKLSPGKN